MCRVPLGLVLLGALAAAGALQGCGDEATGPVPELVGPIGPIPSDLTGKVAFTTMDTKSRIHVVDMTDPIDRVIYTVGHYIDGLSWAPDGEHLAMSSVDFRDPDTSKLHQLTLAGGDAIVFDATGPELRPAYSTDGRLAYFARWSDDPASGIHIDGQPIYPLPLGEALAWAPDGSALFYTAVGSGLKRLTLPGHEVTEIVAAEGGEAIIQPAVSPDGKRIAFVRFGGSRSGQEIWLASVTGADAHALVTGSGDGSPAWTPGGAYVGFSRSGGSAPGIYVVRPSGGMPQRIIGITPSGAGSMAWTR